MTGCSFLPAPYCYRCFFELEYPKCSLRCARALEDILLYDTYGDVACFIAEPILGEGGIIAPPDDYFLEIDKILKKHGILLLIDEVQTGFCRTGKMFGIEHYGLSQISWQWLRGLRTVSIECLHRTGGSGGLLQARGPSFDIWRKSSFLRSSTG